MFDTETNEWTELTELVTGSLPSARSHFGVRFFGNYLYVFGGWSSAGSQVY
jgi:hypothetical protein